MYRNTVGSPNVPPTNRHCHQTLLHQSHQTRRRILRPRRLPRVALRPTPPDGIKKQKKGKYEKKETKAKREERKALARHEVTPPSAYNGRPDLAVFDKWTYEVNYWVGLRNYRPDGFELTSLVRVWQSLRIFHGYVAGSEELWTMKSMYEASFDYCFSQDLKPCCTLA